MILLASEICRLILGFLEDEKFPRTYETFLDECQYLEECRIYIDRGLTFPKKIHGKDLIEYLNINTAELKTYSSVYCQTSKRSTTITKCTQTDSSHFSDNVSKSSKESSTQTVSIELSKSTLNSNQQSKQHKPVNLYKKRQSKLLERKKSVQTTLVAATSNVSATSLDESLDLDNFIQNLCQKDFAQKLAESINELNAKKLNLSLDSSQLGETQPNDTLNKSNKFDQSQLNQTVIENKNYEETNTQIASQVFNQPSQTVLVNPDGFNYPTNNDFNPEDDSKIFIGNEDISLLAEHFSEPAFEALYQLINSQPSEQLIPIGEKPNELISEPTESNVLPQQIDQNVDMNSANNIELLSSLTNQNGNNENMSTESPVILCESIIPQLDLVDPSKPSIEITIDEKMIINIEDEPKVDNLSPHQKETELVEPKVNNSNEKIDSNVEAEPEITTASTNLMELKICDKNATSNEENETKSDETNIEFRFSDEDMETEFVDSNDKNKSESTQQLKENNQEEISNIGSNIIESNKETNKDNLIQIKENNNNEINNHGSTIKELSDNLVDEAKLKPLDKIDEVNDDLNLSIESTSKIEPDANLDNNLTSTQNIESNEDSKNHFESENLEEKNVDSSRLLEQEQETLILEDDNPNEECGEQQKVLDFEPYNATHHENIRSALELLNVLTYLDKKEKERSNFLCVESASDDKKPKADDDCSNDKSRKFEQPTYSRSDSGSFIIIGRNQQEVLSVEQQLKTINKSNENSNSANSPNEEKSDSIGVDSASSVVDDKNEAEQANLEHQPQQTGEDSNSSASYSIPPTPFLKHANTIEDLTLNDLDENLLAETDLNLSSNAMSPQYSSQQPPKTPPRPENENSRSNSFQLSLSSSRPFKKAVSFQCSFKDIFTNKFTPTKQDEFKLKESDESESKIKNNIEQNKEVLDLLCDEPQVEPEINSKETTQVTECKSIDSQNDVNTKINQQNNQIEMKTNIEEDKEDGEIDEEEEEPQHPILGSNLNDCSKLLNEGENSSNKKTSTPTKQNNEITQPPLTNQMQVNQEEIFSQSLSYSSSSSTNVSPNKTPKTPRTPNSSSKTTTKPSLNSNETTILKQKELNIDEILQLVKPTSLITNTTSSIKNHQSDIKSANNQHNRFINDRNAAKKSTIREIFDSRTSTESIIRASSCSIVYKPGNKESIRNEPTDAKKNDTKQESRSHKLSSSELKRKREYFDDFMRDDYECSKRALKSHNSNTTTSSSSTSSNKRSDSRDRGSSSSSSRYDRYDKRYSSYSSKKYYSDNKR